MSASLLAKRLGELERADIVIDSTISRRSSAADRRATDPLPTREEEKAMPLIHVKLIEGIIDTAKMREISATRS